MSTEPKGITTPPDPEKGILEPPLLSYDPKDDEKAALSKDPPGAPDLKTPAVIPARPARPAPKSKKKVSKWILFTLWFNTYRSGPYYFQGTLLKFADPRKFFTFTFGLNMLGLGLAAGGHFPYAIKYSGAMVVANFNFAILMRNEVFGRVLYLFVNTCFAKVRRHEYTGSD